MFESFGRGQLVIYVRCNGKLECRSARALPTDDPEKIKNFLNNTGFVEMPHRGWVCSQCRRAIEEETRQADQPEAAPAMGAIVRIETYHDRLIDVVVAKSGFDANLDGRPLLHSFETAEAAMDAMKGFLDSLTAYQERQQAKQGGVRE